MHILPRNRSESLFWRLMFVKVASSLRCLVFMLRCREVIYIRHLTAFQHRDGQASTFNMLHAAAVPCVS